MQNRANSEKEWTLLMYWDADNNLEFCTEFAMSTWEEALPSNEEVNIVALVDILSEEGVWIYDIVDGERRVVDTWPEKNTSDPAVLEEFLVYGLENYPAEKTMLVVQDHGYAWRGICQDETNGDTLMPVDGLRQAIENAREANKGVGVDLLAFDACHMASIEVAYELKDAVPYMVGSQSMVPFDGLPYAMFIGDIVADPDIGPAELAANIVREYVLYYSSKEDYPHIKPYDQDFSAIAAFDMSKVGALGEAFIEMTAVLEGLVAENWHEIGDARGYAQVTQWANSAGYEFTPDAYTLFEAMMGIDPVLDEKIIAFHEAFDAAIIEQASSVKMGPAIHGLNIWFPPSEPNYNSLSWVWAMQFVYHDVGLDLVAESSWVDCLFEYYTHAR